MMIFAALEEEILGDKARHASQHPELPLRPRNLHQHITMNVTSEPADQDETTDNRATNQYRQPIPRAMDILYRKRIGNSSAVVTSAPPVSSVSQRVPPPATEDNY